MINRDLNLINRLFPFYLVVNSNLLIVSAGMSIQKIAGNCLNKSFSSVFKFIRPGLGIQQSFESISKYENQIFILQHINDQKNIRLKGQIINFEAHILFCISPWIKTEADFINLGLTVKDFALHDSAFDMLNINKALELSLLDVKTANSELETAKEKLTSVINSSDEMMYELSLTGEIKWVNNAWKNNLGFTDDEVLGRNLAEFIDEQSAHEFLNSLNSVSRGLDVNNVSILFASKSGEVIIAEGQIRPVYQKGEITGSNSFVRNVTPLRKSLERYQLLLDTMQEGVLFVNLDDEIVFANKCFCRMLEYDEIDIIGKKANQIFLDEEDTRRDLIRITENRKDHLISSYELPLKTKSGNKIWVKINGAPVKDSKGNVIGTIGTHTDISVLKQHLKDLEEIVFSISHKLRKPVVNILAISDLLSNDYISFDELRKIAEYLRDSVLLLDNFSRELVNLTTDMKEKKESNSPFISHLM